MRALRSVPIGFLFVLLGWALLTRPAHAQTCIAETEPNEQPGVATPVAIGCVEGEIKGSDQDFYKFTFDDTAAAQRWTLAAEGVPGQPTTVQILRIKFADNGVDVAENTKLAVLDLPDGSPQALNDLLLRAGDYYVGVTSLGEGPYRLTWQPGAAMPANGDAEPNDGRDTATPLAGAFTLSGDLQGSSDEYRWTIGDADAGQRWRLLLQSPLGEAINLTLTGPNGESLVYGTTADGGRYDAYELGLDAGDYALAVAFSQDYSLPYVLVAEPVGTRSPAQEEEPNDRFEQAKLLDPVQGMQGAFQPHLDEDFYRFTVDDAFAQQQWSLNAQSDAPADLELCLLDATGNRLQCRESDRAQPGRPGAATRRLRCLRARSQQQGQYLLAPV